MRPILYLACVKLKKFVNKLLHFIKALLDRLYKINSTWKGFDNLSESLTEDEQEQVSNKTY